MLPLAIAIAVTAAPMPLDAALTIVCLEHSEEPQTQAAWARLAQDRDVATVLALAAPEPCDANTLVPILACGAEAPVGLPPPRAPELAKVEAALIRQLSSDDPKRAWKALQAASWAAGPGCATRDHLVAALAPAAVAYVKAQPPARRCHALVFLASYGRAAAGAVPLFAEALEGRACDPHLPLLLEGLGPDALPLLPQLLASTATPDFDPFAVGAIGALGLGARSATPTLMRLLEHHLAPGGDAERGAAAAKALAGLEAAGAPQPGVQALLARGFTQRWKTYDLVHAMLPLANVKGAVRERLLALMATSPEGAVSVEIAEAVGKGKLPLTPAQRAKAEELKQRFPR